MERSLPRSAANSGLAAAVPPGPMPGCQDCRHTGAPCLPGLMMLGRLRAALAMAGAGPDFALSGTVELTGCPRVDGPCTAGWHLAQGEAWLFGDVGPEADPEALVATGGQAAAGSRAPAAVLVCRTGVLQ